MFRADRSPPPHQIPPPVSHPDQIDPQPIDSFSNTGVALLPPVPHPDLPLPSTGRGGVRGSRPAARTGAGRQHAREQAGSARRAGSTRGRRPARVGVAEGQPRRAGVGLAAQEPSYHRSTGPPRHRAWQPPSPSAAGRRPPTPTKLRVPPAHLKPCPASHLRPPHPPLEHASDGDSRSRLGPTGKPEAAAGGEP